MTDVYQGGDGNRSELGQGADVVLQLAASLPSHQNFKIYADNFFTSVPLVEKLMERGMHYVGTVRPNRLLTHLDMLYQVIWMIKTTLTEVVLL